MKPGVDDMTDATDILVIGGGPAGMMAAGRAAELGANVALVEKNRRPGTKLLMTGGGRCNLTNASICPERLVEHFGKPGRFLYPSVRTFGVPDLTEFFGARGLTLNTGPGGRVFPETDSAKDVLRVLLGYMREGGVKLVTGHAVTGFEKEANTITAARTPAGLIRASSFILCTGGRSFPATGSTGESYGFLESLGHTVVTPAPALTPIRVKEGWVRRVEGAGIADAVVSAWSSGKKCATASGGIIFTGDGLSGPAALDMSASVGELLKAGEVMLHIDLVPGTASENMDAELISLFDAHPNMLAKNIVERLVPPKLAPTVTALAGLDPEMRLNKVPRIGRLSLGRLLKRLPLTVSGLHGFRRAMVTSGGVPLNEVDPKTMRSKLVDNLFIAGELLDIIGPTGGYNLQICWSTGYAAGDAAGRMAK